jgi:hypothetical protein
LHIALVSDSHSNHVNVNRAIARIEALGLTTVLHAGDIADPGIVYALAEFETYFVFGNVDEDREPLRAAMRETGAVCCEEFGAIELAGRKIALLHGDDKRRLDEAEHSGRYDLVCYGHTHKAESHCTGPTLVVNPGALHRARPHTFAVYDTEKAAVEFVPA